MAINSTETKVENLLKKPIEDLGYTLYDIEYVKQGKEFHLIVYIEKEGGVDLIDCEKVSDVINPILDTADPIKEQYFLEVSSSGIEKALRKVEHYKKQIGNKIEVKLFSKINNENCLQGILKDVDDESINLELNGEEIKIYLKQISSAKSVYEW